MKFFWETLEGYMEAQQVLIFVLQKLFPITTTIHLNLWCSLTGQFSEPVALMISSFKKLFIMNMRSNVFLISNLYSSLADFFYISLDLSKIHVSIRYYMYESK